MGKNTFIAAVVLNWNSAEQTLSCLRQIYDWAVPDLDIFLVDNGSIDDSMAIILNKYKDLSVLCNDDNLGFGGGCNVALKEILCAQKRYESILLLNNDAGVDVKSLYRLVSTLAGDSEVGVVGPVITKADNSQTVLSAGGLDPATHVNTYDKYLRRKNKTLVDAPFEVDYVPGTVALLRASLLKKTGLFDERYFFSCEMADLCERIKRHGYTCVVNPHARAWHDMEEAGECRSTLYLYYIVRNRFLFIRRNKKRALCPLFVYWMSIGILFMSKSLLARKFSRVRAIGLALRDGMLGRYGGRNYLFIDL